MMELCLGLNKGYFPKVLMQINTGSSANASEGEIHSFF